MMSYRVLKLAGGICAALWLFAAATASGISSAISPAISPALAQNNDAKPGDQQSAAPKEGAKDNAKDSAKDSAKDGAKDGTKEPQKIDEFAEAQRTLSGPAGTRHVPDLWSRRFGSTYGSLSARPLMKM